MSAISEQLIPESNFRRAGAATFGILFLLESLVRAFNSGILAIQAYDLLGSSRAVSILGTCVSVGIFYSCRVDYDESSSGSTGCPAANSVCGRI